MLNSTFGKYIVSKSDVHNLNSTFKILSLIIMLITSFFINCYKDVIMLLSYLILSLVYSNINIKIYLKELSYFNIFIFIILIIDIIFLTPTEIIVSDMFRIIFIVLYYLLFIHITTFNEIISSIEKILSPLKGIIRIHSIALYIALIIKFPVVYLNEKERITRTYKERKILKEKKILDKIKKYKENVVLSFNSSIEKLNNISTNMKIKLYGYGKSRTNYRENKFSIKSSLLLILNIIILLIVMFY